MKQDLHWKLTEQKHILQDQWISLRADTYQMPNGRTVSPYYVLEYPHFINVVAITEGSDVVMIRQYRPARNEVRWELPGGMMDAEESSVETARRELLEETGFTANHFEELARTSVNPASHTNLSISVLATGARQVASPQWEDTEEIEMLLMPLDEVLTMLHRNEISQSMDVVTLFYAMQWLKR